MALLNQMIIFFLIMSIGYLIGKKKYIDDKGTKAISWIVVNVANPALILSSGMGETSLKANNIVLVLCLAVAVYITLILVSFPVSKVLNVDKPYEEAYSAMLVFSNIGFMGIPIVSAVYGPDAVIFASLFVFPYNILIYSFGLDRMSGETAMSDDPKAPGAQSLHSSSKKKAKNTKYTGIKRVFRAFNVGSIACLISITILLSGIKMPYVITKTAGNLGELTGPLSMLVIGYSISKNKLGELFTDFKLIIFLIIKQILVPIAGVIILKLFLQNETLINVCTIMLAAPVGSMVAMMAQESPLKGPLATKAVAISTIFSTLTIPFVSDIVCNF